MRRLKRSVRRRRISTWRQIEPSVRTVEAAAAAAAFRFPGRRLRIIGVTGTDGKTSTAHLIHTMLKAAGERAGIMSTVTGATVTKAQPFGCELTTPNPWILQRLLRDMLGQGAQWAVLEATSHGLALQRLACVPVDVAVLTSVSSDHLDFHGTIDEYTRAKTKLFAGAAVGVINADAPFADRFARAAARRRIYYGIEDGDVSAREILASPRAAFLLDTPLGSRRVQLRLPGATQVKNALAATAAGVAIGLELDQIVWGLEHAPPLAGRMEWVPNPGGCQIVIDHAHTPDALSQLYTALRPLADGQLIAVLGIDGDRDRRKRPELGRVAGRMCDRIVLTSTHPRREAPAAIVEHLRQGVDQHAADYEIVLDRPSAITRALELADARDLVVLTGIGQEPYLSGPTGKVPWSERIAVERALSMARQILD
jgi:UDP-N-acetylmuramoyl-L-alanyl-D-glutamate--2,6-diaminopimelate ligase